MRFLGYLSGRPREARLHQHVIGESEQTVRHAIDVEPDVHLIRRDHPTRVEHVGVGDLAHLRGFRRKVPQLEILTTVDVIRPRQPNGHRSFGVVVALDFVQAEDDVL